MKNHAKNSLLALLFWGGICLFAEEKIDYKLPILTVCGDQGDCTYLDFSFSRDGNAPLQISIAEDMPGGSTETIRGSIWQAAMTAAMLKNDALNGVKISVAFSGKVDGPSAGAIFCLGILSGLDNRSLPPDFAMTGTIMPDGTIGLVGGVAKKMRGAAQKGISRMCIPAFMRNERQADNIVVDLYREAESLGIKLCPVENISQAYAEMYQLSIPSAPSISDREACSLSRATEDVLTNRYLNLHANFLKSWKALPQDRRNALIEGNLPSSFDNAEKAFSSGYLLIANDLMTKNIIDLWSSQELYKISNKDLTQENLYFQIFKFCYNSSQKLLEDMTAGRMSRIYLIDHQGKSPIWAQLDFGNEKAIYLANFYLYQKAPMSEKKFAELSDEQKVEYLTSETCAWQILISMASLPNFARRLQKEIEPTIPRMDCNQQVENVLRLFRAADTSVENLIACSAQNQIISQDVNYYICRLGEKDLIQKEQQDKSPYSLVNILLTRAELLAYRSSLQIKYGPDLGYTDGTYQNTHFLNYLLRSARKQALYNLSECKNLGIPCISAIDYFQYAEIQRDAKDSDKLEVVRCYWAAGLMAKALALSFK